MITIQELYDIYLQHPQVCTDTRHCEKGSIFFALHGEHFDGNQYALDALAKGCAYAVVDNAELAQQDERLLFVTDVLKSLQHLAHLHRKTLEIPVLQITGTNGKTTTKELVAAVLSQHLNVLYTQGNLNNHIGVPLTLLRLRKEHQLAIVETGANHPGEIATLSKIIEPDCALITNVGKAHLEGFGSFDAVINTKCEVYDYLRRANKQLEKAIAAGVPEMQEEAPRFVFVDHDNPVLIDRAKGLPQLHYGSPNKGGIVEGKVVACDPFLTVRYCEKDGAWHTVQTQLIGAYNLQNILAAITVGLTFKVPLFKIDRALREYSPNNQRSEFRQTAHNRLIIDAYNANISSMKAALQNFANIVADNKTLILGEMRELGEYSTEGHQDVLRWALQSGSTSIWLVGKAFANWEAWLKDIAPALAVDQLAPIQYFENTDIVKAHLQQHPLHERFILLKGSNGTRLFELTASL